VTYSQMAVYICDLFSLQKDITASSYKQRLGYTTMQALRWLPGHLVCHLSLEERWFSHWPLDNDLKPGKSNPIILISSCI